MLKVIPELKQKLNHSEANFKVCEKKISQLSFELDQADEQHEQDEQIIERLRREKNAIMEQSAKSEREKKTAEDARDKAENQIVILKDIHKTLCDKSERQELDLLSAQERIRELENERNKLLAEPEMKSYNITVVESEPMLESAPISFSFEDDTFKDEMNQKMKDLNDKVTRLEGERPRFLFMRASLSEKKNKVT